MPDVTLQSFMDTFLTSPTVGDARTNLGLGGSNTPTFAGLTLSAGTITASAPVSLTQTWNNAAVAFTGINFNVTNTASSASSLLFDLQVGGASQFRVRRDGVIFTGSIEGGGYASFSNGACSANPNSSGSFVVGSNSGFHFVSTSSNSFITPDTFLRGPAPATLQLGLNNASTPTAQTVKAHNVTTGTGASLTRAGGTGSAAGGSVILATSATTGAPVAALTVNASRDITLGDGTDLILNVTTGTKIGTGTTQKLGFWGVTPIQQPTTGVAASTRVAGVLVGNHDDTYDGYTVAQVVKALRDAGILA